jgi:WD40 repeat protein
MKSLKKVMISILLLGQGVSFGAEAQPAASVGPLPGEITIVCYDKGVREDRQPMLIDGVMESVSSGRVHKVENGRIEHVLLADLKDTFYLFEKADEESRDMHNLECNVSVLRRVLFDYGVGGVADPDPETPAVYGDDYEKLVAILRPKKQMKNKQCTAVASVETVQDPTTLMRDKLPDTVTLKCTDGILSNVPIDLLVHNFKYFDAYFRNWGTGRFAYTGKEVSIEGSVQDMKFLLSYVIKCYFSFARPPYLLKDENLKKMNRELYSSVPFTSYVSSLLLANQLCLKKDAMDHLLISYSQKIQEELYGKTSYEKFLKEGDPLPFLTAMTIGNFVTGFSRIDMTVQLPHGFKSEINSLVTISPDGHYGVMKINPECLQVCDLTAGNLTAGSKAFRFSFDLIGVNRVLRAKFSPNSKFLWLYGGKRGEGWQVWDMDSHELVLTSRGPVVKPEVQFSPDSKWILSENYFNSTEALWNIAEKKLYKFFEKKSPWSTVATVFSSTSRWVVFSSALEVEILDLAFGKGEEKNITTADMLRGSISFSPDGKKMGGICMPEYNVYDFNLYDLEKNVFIAKIPAVKNYAFTENSSLLVLEKENNTVVFYDLITRQETFICSGTLVGQSVDGKVFILFDGSHYSFITLTLKARVSIGEIDPAHFGFDFNTDSSLVVVAVDKNKIQVFETSTGSSIFDISLEGVPAGAWIEKVKFGSNGTFLIVDYALGSKQDIRACLITLPLEKAGLHLSAEERYFNLALHHKVQEAGHKLDTLSLPENLEVMFDRFPRVLQDEILTTEGRVKRELVRDVKGIYARVRGMFGVGKERLSTMVENAVTGKKQSLSQEPVLTTVNSAENVTPWHEEVE